MIRLAASTYFTDLTAGPQPQRDERLFTTIAWNLTSGYGYSLNGEIPTARRPPVYPIFLAGLFYLFGKSWIVARVANVIIGSLTVGVIYLIGHRLFDRKIALIAALTSALNPSFVKYSLALYSDILFVFLFSLFLLFCLLIYEKRKSIGLQLTCGLLLGLAILTRSELLLFIPFLLFWVLTVNNKLRSALRTFAIIVFSALLLIIPWLTRNYFLFDGPVMATNLGRVMWGVYNPETFSNLELMGGWHPPELAIKNLGEVSIESQNPNYLYLPEREWDWRQIELAIVALKGNITQLPRMELYKVRSLVLPSEGLQSLFTFPIVYCFFFGLILTIASGDTRFRLIHILLIYFVTLTLFFYTNQRLRMSAELVSIVVASYGLVEQIELVRVRVHQRVSDT